jgi:beta-galactosidase
MNLENIRQRFVIARHALRLRNTFWFICLNLLVFGGSLAAQTYSPPASGRSEINLDPNWRFIRQDVSGAEAAGFDDSSWTNVNLPHTWNNFDGQDGPNTTCYRGIGWYRTHVIVASTNAGSRLFLKFDAASLVADVWVNGVFVGEHQGGFSAFAFDVTSNLIVGADNVIAVKVNNASNTNVPPLSGDFTVFGGLYRDVHLLVTDPVQVSPLDYGSPGVYLMPTNVSASSANLQVTTVLANTGPVDTNVMLRTVITDAATNIVATLTNFVTLTAGSVSNVVTSTVIVSPHLWNGLADPYLYQAYVEVWKDTNVVDLVVQPLGFRFFSIDPARGFFLNGGHYDLHGVSIHQDWLNCGWALNDAQRETNFMFIKEIGATIVRLAHYQHDDYTYSLADQNGVVLWTEVPLVNSAPANDANTLQQLHELIRQQFNHPSVLCWGMYNEITGGNQPIIGDETNVVSQDDPTRPTTAASNRADGDPTTFWTSLICFNKYYGWYNAPIDGMAAWADGFHNSYPNRLLGISEYGAGASIYQHSENPNFPPTGGTFHPEEWQNLVHETNWLILKTRPYLCAKIVWNMFDFASDTRTEGDTFGRNDKGLVTFDRQVRKDAFYFYKANWTTNPMVYITGHTFTNRLTNYITAKVYANCDSVQLYLNGISQGSVANTNCIFHWPVALFTGTNMVQAVGIKGGIQVTDSLFWIAPISLILPGIAPPVAAVISPATNVVYLNSTNDTLLLSATASNTVPTNAMTTTWSQTGGPGIITFANSNALTTTANFSSNGIYNLTFTASNGSITNITLTVAVNIAASVTNGLLGWWKMDETGGATAFDSSVNGLNATVSGATFSTGYTSNALALNGGNNNASFTSPDTAQTTVAAWVRADGSGNSSYPFILGTPGYHIIFRFDGSANNNALDFATAQTANTTLPVNGEWVTAPNTISTGVWYHVAISYDKSSLANVPVLYVNGVRMALTTSANPSVKTPSYTGTTCIGNRQDGTRGWNGLIDDLRIYNRLLADSEVQSLASIAPANSAPVVNAGANQIIVRPTPASLNGTVTDGVTPTITWSKISGPGNVTFANASSPVTAASFSTGGSYQLQLAASDGQATTVSSLTVTAITQPNLALQLISSNTFQLSWPASNGNWQLQYQANPIAAGLGTNWQNFPGPVTNPFVVPIDPTVGTVFYRLLLLTN